MYEGKLWGKKPMDYFCRHIFTPQSIKLYKKHKVVVYKGPKQSRYVTLGPAEN